MSSEAPANTGVVCTCGQGGTFWGHCDRCEIDRWVIHHCPGGCDDVTCENGQVCLSCWTGQPCPMHDGEDDRA